jgi:hypothetical protein
VYNRSDILLYVLSAKGDVSWGEFKKVYDHLYAVHVLPNEPGETNIRFSRSRAARALDSLGHCDLEFSKDSQRVYSGPPVLARLPRTGLPQAVLAGARFPQTVQRLADACKAAGSRVTLTVNDQPGGRGLFPTRVVVRAEYASDIAKAGCSLGIKFENEPPVWPVLNFSASINEYMGTLRWARARDVNWPCRDFNFDSLSYTGVRQPSEGVRLGRYTDPVRNTPVHLLWKEGQCAEVDGDWGRYLALREAGARVLTYDPLRFLFAAPRTVPLPRLVARALTLCSGNLPLLVNAAGARLAGSNPVGFAVYQAIPPLIARLAATKLGQELTTCSIDM